LIVRLKAQAVLERRTPKMLFKLEYLEGRQQKKAKELHLKRNLLANEIHKWAAKFGIDESLWYLWDKDGVVLTSVGAMLPISAAVEENDERQIELSQAIHVLERGAEQSLPIFNLDYSLMSFLANSALYALRLYVLLPPDKEGVAGEIQISVKQFWDSLED
jgi:hypothetical protein